MNKTGKIAISGVLGAVAVVLMLLTGIITIGTFALPALAGALSVMIVTECDVKYGVMFYLATAFLTFLLAPDKEAALYYIAFFGYYPIVKSLIEGKLTKTFQWILKFAVFNIAMVLCFFVSVYILSIPKDSFEMFGFYVPYVFLIIGNFVFYFYDVTLTSLITLYLYKWRKYIFRRR